MTWRLFLFAAAEDGLDMALPPFELAAVAREMEAQILEFAPPVALEDSKGVERDTLHAARVDAAKDEARRIVLTRIFLVDPDLTLEPQTIFQAGMFRGVSDRLAHRLLGNRGMEVGTNVAVGRLLSFVAPARVTTLATVQSARLAAAMQTLIAAKPSSSLRSGLLRWIWSNW